MLPAAISSWWRNMGMPKQCPECRTVTADDIGYCPACACQLKVGPDSESEKRLWRYAAVAVAIGSLVASILHFLRPTG